MANTLKFGAGQWATKEGSTLAYNDENDNYKPLPFTFTRASNATVVNKAGLIETVGNGIPRIDFLGNTSGALKLEPQSTNLITQSELFSDAYWSKTNSSVVGGFISPDGTTNAFKLIENTGNATHQIQRNLGVISGNVTYSVFAKSSERDIIFINAYTGSTNVTFFDLENGTVLTNASGNTAKIELLPNGYYRCSVERVANALVLFEVGVSKTDGVRVYQGDGTSGVYIYGAQLEEGSYATSYIPTQGSAVTRLADARTDSALPSTIVSQTEGTIFFKINKSESTGVANRELIVLETPNRASGGLIRVLTTVSKSVMRVLFQINGGIPFDVNIPSQYTPLNTDLKFAIAFKSGDSAVYINGVSTNTSTSTFTIPEQFDNFYLNFSEVKAKFSEIKLYNTRLSNSELQALTS